MAEKLGSVLTKDGHCRKSDMIRMGVVALRRNKGASP